MFRALLVYLLLAPLLSFVDIQGDWATPLTAPLFILIPLGAGLFLLSILSTRAPLGLGRAQIALLAYLSGALLMIQTYVLIERYSSISQHIDWISAGLYIMAVSGFFRQRHLFILNTSAHHTLRWVFYITVPLITIRYLGQISAYGDFPILDLYQRVHFHKGALEFSHFDTLNPFVADSYIPFQQVLLGLLNRYFNFDPLIGEWYLPIIGDSLRIAGLYVIIQKLTSSRTALVLALALNLAISGISNPTNGELAEIGSLLLLSMLLSPAITMRRILLVIVIALITLFAAKTLFGLPVWISLIALVILSPLSWYWGQSSSRLLAIAAPIVITIISLFPYHRSTQLFIPLVLAIATVLIGIKTWLQGPNSRLRFSRLTLATLLTGSVIVIMLAVILSELDQGPHDEFGLWPLFSDILRVFLGKNLVVSDADLVSGLGGKVALFELARTLSVFLSLAVIISFLGSRLPSAIQFLFQSAPPNNTSRLLSNAPPQVDHRISALYFVSALLTMAILSGFPFIHRASYLPSLTTTTLFALIVANQWQSQEKLRQSYNQRWLLAAGLYSLSILVFLLILAPITIAPYIDKGIPLFLGLPALVLMVIFISTHHKRWQLAVAIALIATIALEKSAIFATFKGYAYNQQTPPKTTATSHFDKVELTTADEIRQLARRGSILVSDPVTMSLLQARTGLNTIVSFSNIDTMPSTIREQLAKTLRRIIASTPNEPLYLQLIKNLRSGAHHYASQKHSTNGLHSSMTGSQILAEIQYNNALVPKSRNTQHQSNTHPTPNNAVECITPELFWVVISARTLEWAKIPTESELNYFPQNNAMSAIQIQHLLSTYKGAKRVGKSIVFPLTCHE